jgi:GH15 family glucan-1,4-alpha-glucosidase
VSPRRRSRVAVATEPYPPINDYALIGDGHSAALVSRSGSIDWCCMPRMDDASIFGRLLDWEEGGHCTIQPDEPDVDTSRTYLGDTMVLETTFRCASGSARVVDCFTMHEGGATDPHRQLLRTIEGIHGEVPMIVEVAPRFDYGAVRPWLRLHDAGVWSAVGGDDAIVIGGDVPLERHEGHDLRCVLSVRAGSRHRLSIASHRPEAIDPAPPDQPGADELDERLEETLEWWRQWCRQARPSGPDADAATRSALVLKALIHAPTGAMAAAATTSLPEAMGGARNWDYRYSWIRDSVFAVRSLAELGWTNEADGFRRFVERSAAGQADELQIMFGLGGERRLTELELPLEGYRRSAPVRVGNAAAVQLQLDVYGELLDLAWRWHQRGLSPDDDYWRFLLDLVDTACRRWKEPDRGIWELRGDPRHLVHSKAMCWVAVDRGIRLAEDCLRQAPLDRWKRTRAQIRRDIERHGVDPDRGCLVQAYGATDVDASLLLLPSFGFLEVDDPVMVATVDAVRADLDDGGLTRRYNSDDGLEGEEGTFIACAFWLAECLADQGRVAEAREVYDRAASTCNDLGLFAEEFDTAAGEACGNFPQALTHLSQMSAAVALAQASAPRGAT